MSRQVHDKKQLLLTIYAYQFFTLQMHHVHVHDNVNLIHHSDTKNYHHRLQPSHLHHNSVLFVLEFCQTIQKISEATNFIQTVPCSKQRILSSSDLSIELVISQLFHRIHGPTKSNAVSFSSTEQLLPTFQKKIQKNDGI